MGGMTGMWRRPGGWLAVLIFASGCAHLAGARHVPRLNAGLLLSEAQRNLVGFRERRVGTEVLVEGRILRTGVHAVDGDAKLVTAFAFGVAVTKKKQNRYTYPYVVLEYPDDVTVWCVLNPGWDGDLVDAEAGRTLVATGDVWSAEPNSEGGPRVTVSGCRVRRVFDAPESLAP